MYKKYLIQDTAWSYKHDKANDRAREAKDLSRELEKV